MIWVGLENRTFVGLLAFGLAVACAIDARAQESTGPALHDPFFGVEFSAGFAGQVSIDSDDVGRGGATLDLPGGGAIERDSEFAFGGGIRFMKRVYDVFWLGSRIGVQSWRSDVDFDAERNLAVDLSLVPQFGRRLSRAVELYFAVPFGLTFNVLNELEGSLRLSTTTQSSSDFDVGFGWNLAFMLGIHAAVSSRIGLFAEAGYAFRQVSHTVNFSPLFSPVSPGLGLDLDVAWSQVAVNAGVTF